MQVSAARAAGSGARDGSYFHFARNPGRIAQYSNQCPSDAGHHAAGADAAVVATLPDLWPPDAVITVHPRAGTIAKKVSMTNQHKSTASKNELTSIADAAYPMAVLTLYVNLPDTPRRASSYDQTVARSLFEQAVPLDIVEAALLLGSLRRLIRPPGAPPLPRIRSLAYFSPVIAELQQQPMPASYLEYLRRKASQEFPQSATFQDR